MAVVVVHIVVVRIDLVVALVAVVVVYIVVVRIDPVALVAVVVVHRAPAVAG